MRPVNLRTGGTRPFRRLITQLVSALRESHARNEGEEVKEGEGWKDEGEGERRQEEGEGEGAERRRRREVEIGNELSNE